MVHYVEFYEYAPEQFSLTLARGGTLRNVGSADVKYIQCETEREAAQTLLQEINDDPQHNYASPHQIRQAQAILEGDPAH